MNNKNLRLMLAAGLVSFTLGGCATLEDVPIDRSKPETVQSQLAVGDTVYVRLQRGDVRHFRIVALEPDAIVGRHERIAYQDIDLIEVKKVDYEGPIKTGAAVAVLALVYIAAMVIEDELNEEEVATCDSNGVGGCIPR